MISNCQTSMEISDEKLFEYLIIKASKLKEKELEWFLIKLLRKFDEHQLETFYNLLKTIGQWANENKNRKK